MSSPSDAEITWERGPIATTWDAMSSSVSPASRGRPATRITVLADALDVRERVRGEDHRQAVVGDDAHELLQQRETRDGIEVRHRLIEQQELRAFAEGKAE